MDTSSTLLGIGLLLVFIAPVGYLVINQSRREKAGKKFLFTIASRLNLQISQFLILDGLSLGLDDKQRKLLTLGRSNMSNPEVIDLSECKVHLIKKYHNDNPTAPIDELREISLRVDCCDKATKLNFYRSGPDPVTEKSMRLQKALEWEKRLMEFQQKS